MDLDDYNFHSLENYFNDENNISKILYSFINQNFKITIQVDEKIYSNEHKIDLNQIVPIRAIFNVKYDSNYGKLQYLYNNTLLREFPFQLTSSDYRFTLDIVVFDLNNTNIENEEFGTLFKYNSKITPLIYVNDNYFSNYTLYDVDLLRRKKASSTLPQQIGFINIISNSEYMSFNSDRTNFSQNQLTDCIKNDIMSINKEIQEKGASLKKEIFSAKWITSDKSVKERIDNDYTVYM